MNLRKLILTIFTEHGDNNIKNNFCLQSKKTNTIVNSKCTCPSLRWKWITVLYNLVPKHLKMDLYICIHSKKGSRIKTSQLIKWTCPYFQVFCIYAVLWELQFMTETYHLLPWAPSLEFIRFWETQMANNRSKFYLSYKAAARCQTPASTTYL